MPVVRVIEVGSDRLEVYVNAEHKAAITIGPWHGDGTEGAVIALDADDLSEFIKQCRETLKDLRANEG